MIFWMELSYFFVGGVGRFPACPRTYQARAPCPPARLLHALHGVGSEAIAFIDCCARGFAPLSFKDFLLLRFVRLVPLPGVCFRALRRLPGQDFHLLEQRVFQDVLRS